MRNDLFIGAAAFMACTGLAMGQTNATEVPPANGTTTTSTAGGITPANNSNSAKKDKETIKPIRAKPSSVKATNRVATTNAGDPFPAYTTANRPAKQHVDLTNSFVGEWTTTTTAWTTNGTQTTTTGNARFFPAMSGRFICGDLEGTMWGKPFKGMGFWGYNTNQNRYENTWVDTENTGISTFTGTKTDDNTFTWTGTVTNPETGKAEQTKCVTTFTGKDTFQYTMYGTNTAGTEYKAFETTYTRVSQGGPFAIRPVENRLTGTTPKTTNRTTSVTDQQLQTEK